MSKGNEELNCLAVRDQLALLLYGELSFDEEERVESHMEHCPECRAALQLEKELHAAFDNVAVEPSPALLRECRDALDHDLRGLYFCRSQRRRRLHVDDDAGIDINPAALTLPAVPLDS